MRRITLFVLLVLCGCASSKIKGGAEEVPFCEKKYGSQAKIDWVMVGESMDQGRGVGEKLTGFRCVFLEESIEHQDRDIKCEKSERTGAMVCHSPVYSLDKLCIHEELKKYWTGEEFYDSICKK